MADAIHPDGALRHTKVRHEARDVHFFEIVLFGLILVLVALIIHIVLWRLMEYYAAREARQKQPVYPLAARERGQLPAEPVLEGLAPQRKTLAEQRAKESRLHSYGWVDPKAGSVHIPIERAMELVAGKLPVRPEAARPLQRSGESNSRKQTEGRQP